MNDGSTDSSVTKEEVIFVLVLKERTPTLKYLSIEPVKVAVADAPGIDRVLKMPLKELEIIFQIFFEIIW